MCFKVSTIKILIMLALKNINYKASIIGILMMLALKNINYKTSIIGFLMMLALKKINYKTSIIGTLMMLALSGNPPSLILALWNIGILLHKKTKLCKDMKHSV